MANITIKDGQVFKYNMNGEWRAYFYINQRDENGNYIMCALKPDLEITPIDFWKMSERFIKQEMEKGNMVLIDRFCDL